MKIYNTQVVIALIYHINRDYILYDILAITITVYAATYINYLFTNLWIRILLWSLYAIICGSFATGLWVIGKLGLYISIYTLYYRSRRNITITYN